MNSKHGGTLNPSRQPNSYVKLSSDTQILQFLGSCSYLFHLLAFCTSSLSAHSLSHWDFRIHLSALRNAEIKKLTFPIFELLHFLIHNFPFACTFPHFSTVPVRFAELGLLTFETWVSALLHFLSFQTSLFRTIVPCRFALNH